MPPQQKKEERPQEILRAFDARHPGIWTFLTRCRRDRDWPDWCYIPVAAAQVYISHELGLPRDDPSVLRAAQRNPAYIMPGYDSGLAPTLAGWRMGRGIYRYDADLAAALTATPLSGDLPVEVLYHLPEWAVYVEMDRPSARGFFASLEWDVHTGTAEMRLLFDLGDDYPMLLPLHLTASTVAGMVEAARAQFLGNARRLGLDSSSWDEVYGADGAAQGLVSDALPAALNLLLYLCSPEAEYRGGVRPERPAVIKTKRGERMFPASSPRVWRIGESIGARLRQARTTAPNLPDERNSPRPHLRRAHWHTYRTGPGRQNYIVRWLHPILVGYGDDDSAV